MPVSGDGRWLIGIGLYFTIVALVLLLLRPAAAGISGVAIILGVPFSALLGLTFCFWGWKKAHRWTNNRLLKRLGFIGIVLNGVALLAFLIMVLCL